MVMRRCGLADSRTGQGWVSAVDALGSNKLAFKSKVVSRAHAEIWVKKDGKFFIKDTKFKWRVPEPHEAEPCESGE
jgi:hypothetical protein